MLDESFWRKYFRVYDVLNELDPYRQLLKTLVKTAMVNPGEVVLDAGGGTGNLAVLLQQAGADVVGLDYSPEALAIYKEKNPRAEVVRADLTARLPFAEGRFDKIISNNVLYTLGQDQLGETVAEFYRVLKAGGVIVVANPRPAFRAFPIYREHLRAVAREESLFRAATDIIRLAVPLLRVLYYDTLINKENRRGGYRFMGFNEQERLLEEAGFEVSPLRELVYARQAVLNRGVKPQAT